ncbi:MAG TPA: TonB-dependent receptor [Ideonella sp.]|uniref:TonB-dependent receptor n=1 Tax=Ideonella sp. TaxID=1929293 RepID=UPI002E366A41|nr:TonB-dependent receptor [Ideonella sp.]HEX5684701.1 TonB-dependent receptor [Ideonella sp.]
MFQKTRLCTSLLLAFGGGLLATSANLAFAQEVQRVEVTGSSIKRVEAEGALPVQTFSQEDIKKSGVTTVTDFIQQLPVMQGFTVAADSVGGGGGGITTASIHDLGEQYTLVLLNGRRVAPATSGTTIDLNSIPLAAIERIEVLTDGASALYGADAIAGVVNFILKQGAAPFEISARYSQPEQTGGDGYNLSISKGFGDLDADGFSIFASLSYDRQKQLKAADRDFAKTGIINFTDQHGRNLTFFNGSSRSVPPNVDVFYFGVDPDTGEPTNEQYSFNPYLMQNGDCPKDHVVGGDQCIFDYTSTVEISPEQERTGFFASGKLKLGNSGFNLFSDVSYTNAHILARIAPYPAEFSLSPDHPYYATYIRPYISDDIANNLDGDINVKYRLYDMGNRAYDYETNATHVVAGVEGALGSWDFNSALTYSAQEQLQNYVGGFPLADRFQAAIDAQEFDPFPYILGTMPADQLEALKSTQWTGVYNTIDIKMMGVDARAQRELFKLGGGSAYLSLGADWRETSFKQTANDEVANGEILFDDPQAEYDWKRQNTGAFVEAIFPVTKELEFGASLRYDQISGVEDGISKTTRGSTESATTYKLNGKYKPTKTMLVRGSYGTGFRTGTMQEIAGDLVDFGVTGGTYACPFSQSYDPLGYIAAGVICDDLQKEVFQGGNAELKPEKSTQWTLGFVVEPSATTAISIDYWTVNVKDAISSVSEDQILNNPETYLDLYTIKHKASNGRDYVAIKLVPFNIGKVENEGIDWNFKWRDKTDFGRLTAEIGGTHLVKSRYTLPGTDDQWTDSMNKWGVNSAVSFRNVVHASAGLGHGDWSHTLTMNYRDGYKDIHHDVDNCAVDDGVDCIDTQLDVRAYTTWDWQTTWNAMKGLALTAGVKNLLDNDPPLSLRNVGSHQLGYDPRYASAMGRTFYVSGSYKF